MSKLMIFLIRVYQSSVSRLLGGMGCGCRFYPSCSSYGIQAIETHGCMKGLALILARILKCHPFHPGGFDPVRGQAKGLNS